MTTEDFIKNVAHDLFSSRVTLTPIAEAKAIPCNIIPKPAQVIFNPPATIVYWEDGDKTVVRCDNDVFSEEFGYAMACMRKACLLYTSPSPRDRSLSRMPSSA